MMEKIAIQKSRLTSKTIINITRYGNVMATRGSVHPSFYRANIGQKANYNYRS
jgi:UDP-N-acetylglucosamine 4,6-dehydratase/5-epimerase